MFLKNYRKNPFSLLTIIAVFGLTIIVLAAANIINAQTNRGTYLDFTGDGKTDWAVMATPQAPSQPFRWKILGNPASSVPNAAFIRIFDYGLATDVIIPGDYTGDRKTDLNVYRRGTQGIFYTSQFPSGTSGIALERAVPWGTTDDNYLVQGDYDGDGKIDYTVARYNNNGGLTWYILSSGTGIMRAVNFGFRNGAATFGADFTGDGRDELVFTSSVNGALTYYIGDAVTGNLVLVRQWGYSVGVIDRNLQPADYTGDGKADLIAIRTNVTPMVWYIFNPATNTATATWFGFGLVTAGDRPDIPVQGDYDGDGRHDIAVWRGSNHTFYVLRSSDGGLITQPWGEDGDVPLIPGRFLIFAD